jgi:hypothetical protein
MKLRPPASAKKELLGLYATAFQEGTVVSRRDLSRLYNLRCSGIPYCPTRTLLNYGMRGKFEAMSMSMHFYVGVGHSVHNTMQTYLSQTGKFLADYECRECGKKYPLSQKYECCDLPTHYEELNIDVGKKGQKWMRIQGHVDAVFIDKEGRAWILDFKTTSLKAKDDKEKDPPISYVRQVRAYAYLLWKQYGLKIHGCMLMFIPRDNPQEPTVWEYVITESNEDLKAELMVDKRLHRRTMKADTVEEMLSLSKTKCGGEYCDACKKTPKELKGLFTRLVNKGKFPILQESEFENEGA